MDPPAARFNSQQDTIAQLTFKEQVGISSRQPPLVQAQAVRVEDNVDSFLRTPSSSHRPEREVSYLSRTRDQPCGGSNASKEQEQLQRGWIRQRCGWVQLMLTLLSLLAALGTILGVVCGKNGLCASRSRSFASDAPPALTALVSPTPSPTNAVVVSPVPTFYSYENPTFAPTMSPTESSITMRIEEVAKLILDASWQNEPMRYTLDRIAVDDFTPEEQALHWVLHYDPLGASATAPPSSTDVILERFALLTLWFQQPRPPFVETMSTTSYWTSELGWATELPVCEAWDHVVCDEDDRIVHLQMERIQLTGTISPELALLTDLKSLNLEDNPTLRGPVPESIGRGLRDLVFLDLGPNRLSGTLPSTLGLLTSLTFFSINRCPLIEGAIPPELLQWTNLERAAFFGTNLVGTMPLCALAPGQLNITADCDQVDCPCCAFCCPGAHNGIPALPSEDPCE